MSTLFILLISFTTGIVVLWTLRYIIRLRIKRNQQQQQLAYQASLIEATSHPFISTESEIIVSWNKGAEELYGFTASEAIGRSVLELLKTRSDTEEIKAIRQQLDDRGFWKGEVVHLHKNGTPMHLLLSVTRHARTGKDMNGYIVVSHDISERKAAEDKLSEELRQLASHLQEIREEERAGIAREIHDELGQQLTGIKMDLAWLFKHWHEHDPTHPEKITGAIELVDNTIRTVRRIATELHPSILDDLGLIAAIEWQSFEFQKRSGIHTHFQSTLPDLHFTPSTSIGLFRICQESLTNVARHSGASQVRINLDHIEDDLVLSIRDNGKGLPPQSAPGKTLGLLSMRERALMMGGHLRIQSTENAGLLLEVTVPLKSFANQTTAHA